MTTITIDLSQLSDEDCIHAFDSRAHMDRAHSKLGLQQHNADCGRAEYLALTEDERSGLQPGDVCIHARANGAIAERACALEGI
jgi:hypothetical protein